MKSHLLFRDDFSLFPIGAFPYDPDHSAMGEYHYVTEEGPRGAWTDQVCNYTWTGHGPTWIITEFDGQHAIECTRTERNNPHRIFPTLETGSPLWKNTRVSVLLRKLSLRGMAGLVFCLNHTLDTLVFSLENGSRARLSYRHKEEVAVLAETEYPVDADRFVLLTAETDGDAVRCLIDGKEVLSCRTKLAARGGKAGITADCAARFTQFEVSCTEEEAKAFFRREQQHLEQEKQEMDRHPQMKLWKKLDLHSFGTNRQIRFGHLLGDGSWQIVLAQGHQRNGGDAYPFITCLTAIDLDGHVLWQKGEPSPNAEKLGKLAADLPLQVYDLNGDGVDEVICGWDFEIRVLDGRTGRVLKSAPTPVADEEDDGLIGVPYGTYAFHRLNPDGIRICNFRGLEKPRDLLIKDRYCRVWALDDQLNLLWHVKSDTCTGHCPLPIDINGDGFDEVLVGYRMLDHEGHELWHYPLTEDHTDEIVAGKWKENDKNGYFACVSGTQGFFIGDNAGHILIRDGVGHAQRVSVAKYCPDQKGMQIAVTNYWGHQGCIFLYDQDGQPLWEKENGMNGNIIAPVNWDGNGTELILTNADPEKGGLLNGNGMRAVAFPNDGHPVMCTEALDLTGDDRDELICWDHHSMYIYTQASGSANGSYHPVKFPPYNASNYRGEYAFPDRSFLEF